MAYIRATADTTNEVKGVAVVGSYQMSPPTERPFHVHGDASTAKTRRLVEVALTRAEAQRLVQDWVNMGLFGRHGRVVQTKAAA